MVKQFRARASVHPNLGYVVRVLSTRDHGRMDSNVLMGEVSSAVLLLAPNGLFGRNRWGNHIS